MLIHHQDYAVSSKLHQCHVMHTILDDDIENNTKIPTSYKNALKHEDDEKWKGTISEELKAHKKTQIWRFGPITTNFKLIKCKWEFYGTPEHYKVRLVAKGGFKVLT